MGTKAVAKPLRAAQSGSEPETISLAPEPEPFHQLSRWSRAVSGPSRAVTTLGCERSLEHIKMAREMTAGLQELLGRVGDNQEVFGIVGK